MAVGDSERSRSRVASFDQVAGDVDAQYVRAESRRRQRSGSVARCEVENLKPVGDPKLIDERFAALSHARGDPGEVTLFPQCLVRIDGCCAVSNHHFLRVRCLTRLSMASGCPMLLRVYPAPANAAMTPRFASARF